MARGIYNLCFPVVFLLMLPGYLRRMVRRGGYRRNFGQRLGFYSADVRSRLAEGPPRTWLQAVSVGEMLIALKLVAALRERDPALPLVVSTTTTTGYQLARDRVGADIEVLYTPIDSAGAVRRAFNAVRPRQVVVVDGGLWPNLLWEAKRRGIQTALVNARLSPRSERRFRRARFLAAPLFDLLNRVCVCEPEDFARWQQLGVQADALRYTGSIKFDAPSTGPASDAVTQKLRGFLLSVGMNPGAPVLLAGSTHPGEELMMAGIFHRLLADFPDLQLWLAPRHVERAREVRAELAAAGLSVISRAAALQTPAAIPTAMPPFHALLLDTTGELRDWYALATVVFVGKSMTATGGQNPAEAIMAGRPVIFGPHMENFRDLTGQLLRSHGAVQVADPAALEAACRRLLADPVERARLATAASAQLAAHRGAARRTAEVLLDETKLSPCHPG